MPSLPTYEHLVPSPLIPSKARRTVAPVGHPVDASWVRVARSTPAPSPRKVLCPGSYIDKELQENHMVHLIREVGNRPAVQQLILIPEIHVHV